MKPQTVFKRKGKTFSTSPKLRRLILHKQQAVRNRAYALQESFYPHTEVTYAAVKKRMALLLGICDKKSVIAYLGRPRYETVQEISHTKKYQNSGKTIPLTHTLRRTLLGKLGYIDIFDLGSVYSVKGEWFIHWNHKKQLTLPESSPQAPPSTSSQDEGLQQKRSKVNLSLSLKASKARTNNTRKENHEHHVGIEYVDSSSSLIGGERNYDSESNQRFDGKDHKATVKVISEKTQLHAGRDPGG